MLLLTGYTPPANADDLPTYAYLSKEAAGYLAELPVRGLGTDGLGVDCIRCFFSPDAAGKTGYENLLPVHHALLPLGIPLFESLVGLEALVGVDHAVFVGFPLKVKDGDGSPIRAAAFVY